MKNLICFGEALIDFLNFGTQREDKLSLNNYRQFPGGAPANAAVAVSKLGGNAYFVGQVGDDVFGNFLIDSLNTYGVKTDYTLQHPTASTALAFVTLDNEGDRSFSFYRQQTADILFQSNQLPDEAFENANIFHCCSNTLTDSRIAETTKLLVNNARSKGLLVSFDVNLRHNLWESGTADKEVVQSIVNIADVLKFSSEELEYLADGNIPTYLAQTLAYNCKLLIITDGPDEIQVFTKEDKYVISAPKVKAVDTTAGGDGFIGGVLFQLGQLADVDAALKDAVQIKNIIKFGASCGGHAVSKPGAFPALPSYEEVTTVFADYLK